MSEQQYLSVVQNMRLPVCAHAGSLSRINAPSAHVWPTAGCHATIMTY